MFSIEYLLRKPIVTDEAIYVSLLLTVPIAVCVYQFYVRTLSPGRRDGSTVFCQNAVRYFLAFIFFYYAFIKICGNMFSSSLATLNTPLYQLSGFQLTWRFFGYSLWYNWGIILFQILCGVLLLFRRTTLAGCLLALGMMLNITFINFTHHIQLKLFSVIYTIMLFYFVYLHRKPLLTAVFGATRVSLSYRPGYLQKVPVKQTAGLTAFFLTTLFICSMKEGKMKNDYAYHSPLYGIWQVEKANGRHFMEGNLVIFDAAHEGSLNLSGAEARDFLYDTDETHKTATLWGDAFLHDTVRCIYQIQAKNELVLRTSDAGATKLKKRY